jgi:hypothetical protein
MKTKDFITAIRRSAGKRLLFTNGNSDTIHPGYHLTEIKAAIYVLEPPATTCKARDRA